MNDDRCVADGAGLLGRATDIAVLAALCAEARNARAGVVEVVGEPGVGKTALLEATVGCCGMRVVRASGVQGESHLPLAALSELLRPLRPLGAKLSPRQRSAIGGLLDLGGRHAAVDPYALAAATLALVALAAEEAPLLVVIDDVHWVDEVSGAVLSFALRRLGADAVAVLLARRLGMPAPITGPWPALSLHGLDQAATAALLGSGVTPGVAAAPPRTPKPAAARRRRSPPRSRRLDCPRTARGVTLGNCGPPRSARLPVVAARPSRWLSRC